jgi:hypothetical protein
MPTWWTRIANTGVAVWWPPDLGYTFQLNYTAPAAVLTGAVEPAMPRDYQDVIVYEAAYLMAVRQRDQVAITEMRAERDAVLAGLEAEDSLAQLKDSEKVGGSEIWTGMERRF